jgi:hypothetical protein
MVLVAIAGLVMGGSAWGYRMWRLSSYYASLARMSQDKEDLFRNLGARLIHEAIPAAQTAGPGGQAAVSDEVVRLGQYAAKSSLLAEKYARLVRKYERAARYPWLPIEPDAPEP